MEVVNSFVKICRALFYLRGRVSPLISFFGVWTDAIDVAQITACAFVTAVKPCAIAAFSSATVKKSRIASAEVWRVRVQEFVLG